MRLLLDECVPARLRRSLPSHQVSTVVQEGWSGVKNGKLLALAATGFDAFITVDKNLSYQQNTSNLPVAVLVLDPRMKIEIEVTAFKAIALGFVCGASKPIQRPVDLSIFQSEAHREIAAAVCV